MSSIFLMFLLCARCGISDNFERLSVESIRSSYLDRCSQGNPFQFQGGAINMHWFIMPCRHVVLQVFFYNILCVNQVKKYVKLAFKTFAYISRYYLCLFIISLFLSVAPCGYVLSSLWVPLSLKFGSRTPSQKRSLIQPTPLAVNCHTLTSYFIFSIYCLSCCLL